MGAFAEHAKRIRKLRRIPQDVIVEVSAEVERLVRRQFDTGTDPHGRAYAPRAPATVERHGSGGPLESYAKYLQVSPVRGTTARVVIVFNNFRARFHEKGTGNMPARPLLPGGQMPAAWTQAINDAFKRAVRKQMGAA